MEHERTDEAVRKLIVALGYSLNPMSGVPGRYYTLNRREDIVELAREIIAERREEGAVTE